MDRETLEIVYNEIDKRIFILKSSEQHNYIIKLFENLKESLMSKENKFIEQMNLDFNKEDIQMTQGINQEYISDQMTINADKNEGIK